MTFEDILDRASEATSEAPLRIVVSACLLGEPVGWDGSSWPSDLVGAICAADSVSAAPFCPENHALGTPREYMQLHDGDGDDVLDGHARVVTTSGRDITDDFLRGARAMHALAESSGAVLGILQAVSPSCGSRIVHRGEVEERAYRQGAGVTTALLRREGLVVIGPRDEASLQQLAAALLPGFEVDPAAFDFDRHPWFVEYFGTGDRRES